jgi:hypothetical protein
MRTLLLVLALGAAPPGVNEHFRLAQGLVDGVRYAAAEEELDKALAIEGNTTQQLAEIYELQGIVRAALKRPEEARDAFVRLLALTPGHRFRGEQTPRVMTPYLEARARVQERGALRLSTAPPRFDAAGTATFSLTLKDFLGLAQTVVVRLQEDGVARDLELPASATLRVEAKGARIELAAELLGEHHALLGTLPAQRFDAPAAPSVVPQPKEPPPKAVIEPAVQETPTGAPRVAAIALLAAAAGTLAVGIYFGVTANAARSRFDAAVQQAMGGILGISYSDTIALQRTAQTDAVTANAFFAATGALALVGVAILIGVLMMNAGAEQ